jgi:type VI secretion system secreted protein VgrG
MTYNNEPITLSLSNTIPALSVRTAKVTERMSRLWTIKVLAMSESPDLDLEAPIGRAASLAIRLPSEGGLLSRSWAGLCTQLTQVRVESTGLSSYELIVRPRLWALGERTNYRLFQHQSVLEIVSLLLDEWDIDRDFRVDEKAYPKLELRTQYGESDYAFLSRLLEEAGIATFFEDGAGKTTLVFADAPQSSTPRLRPLHFTDEASLHSHAEVEFARGVRIGHRAVAAAFVKRDYDFRRPGLSLLERAATESPAESLWERYEYEPGGFLHDDNPAGATPHADDRGVGRHENAFGRRRAQLTMERARADKRAVTLSSNVVDLYPGRVFRIVDHPHPTLAENLLAIENVVRCDADAVWTIETVAVPQSAAYRPPAVTDKPRVPAVQNATVVGPQGEEIHTDEFGRVRVQFPWDRYGTQDETSSCWMRVNQGWAGAGYGSITIPRVGQDVLVAFLEGNPDHPVVVGRLFNEATPVPYKLPENKTVTTLRSNSSPSSGGFNELRFEDARGRELVYLQAEKDHMNLVKNNEMVVVGNDRSQLIRGHATETIAKNQTKLVRGALSTTVGASESKTVSESRQATIGDTDATIVGKMFRVTVARSLESPLGKTFEAAYQTLSSVLESSLTSTLGSVPATALGLPFKGNEHGPMAGLAASLVPTALGLLKQGIASIKAGGGRPATGIEVTDEKIVLRTGGASITLSGDDIVLSAAGTITSTSKKETKVIAQASSVLIQGGPMVYINPGEKSAEAAKMSKASHAGAGFIGGK